MFNNKLIPYLFFFSLILILQEGSSGQSIDTTYSFLMYFNPVWSIMYSLTHREMFSQKSEESRLFKKIIYMYLLVFIGQTLIILLAGSSNFFGPFLWNIIRLLTPLISIFLLSLNPIKVSEFQLHKAVDFIFLSCVVALFPKIFNVGVGNITVQNLLISGDLPTESDTLCFAFGMVSVHYIGNRNIKKFLLSLLFVLLTGKRIVFFGLMLVSVLNLRLVKAILIKNLKAVILIILLINSVYAYFLYDIGSGEGKIIDLLENLSSKSTNELTVGRQILYERIIDIMGFPTLFGHGMGSVIYTMRKISPSEQWLHSDILMNFYEAGILGCLYWLLFLYNRFKVYPFLFTVTILYNIFMLTDNAFYYFVPNYVFYLIVFINLRLIKARSNKANVS